MEPLANNQRSMDQVDTTFPLSNLHPQPRIARSEVESRKGVNVKLSFVGANPRPRLEPLHRLNTRVSYFVGSDADQWFADVPVWSGVRYIDLYPGINLEMLSENGRIIERMVITPGANLNAVKLRIDGALTTRKGNYLHLTTTIGEIDLPLVKLISTTDPVLPLEGSVLPNPI